MTDTYSLSLHFILFCQLHILNNLSLYIMFSILKITICEFWNIHFYSISNVCTFLFIKRKRGRFKYFIMLFYSSAIHIFITCLSSNPFLYIYCFSCCLYYKVLVTIGSVLIFIVVKVIMKFYHNRRGLCFSFKQNYFLLYNKNYRCHKGPLRKSEWHYDLGMGSCCINKRV